MNDSQLMRLQRVEVDGLFGIFDHRIELDRQDHVTVLHGPNGVGKTHTLGMINSLLTGNTAYFRRIPCNRFRLTFQDCALELVVNFDRATGKLSLTHPDGDETEEIRLDSETARPPAPWRRFGQGLAPPSPLTLRERAATRGDALTEAFAASHGRTASESELPTWYREFLDNASVRFIETHRLAPDSQGRSIWPEVDPGDSTVPAVLVRSRAFGERLRETLADYGTRAQTLDQTFPQRLMAASRSLPSEELEARMHALKKQTDQLEDLGILREAAAPPSRGLNMRPDSADQKTDVTTARVMTLYVEDTEKKLEALADLSSRLRSFLGALNARFRHKQLRLDRQQGLAAEASSGSALPLDSLSSGEQHQLVLYYDLLFRTRPNTIVLVDEPELSLHVSWQKRFLPDLLEFAELSAFDAIVATHSPYIIGERDDLMVGLGGEV